MKKTLIKTLFSICILSIFIFKIPSVYAAGLLKPLNGKSSDVYIKKHQVNVIINNGFSKTEIDQIFVNKGSIDLEAIYSFPLPKKASLSEVSLWIDGKEVIGEVLEKKEAKKVYEDQKAKGNDTALTEKNDYKTFEVKVYPVRSGLDTRVRLVYYQPLEVDLNIGRYVYPLAEGGVDDEQIAFWAVDSKVQEAFTFNLILKSAFPIKDVRIPAYQNEAVITKLSSLSVTDKKELGEDEKSNKKKEETMLENDYQVTLNNTEGGFNLTKDIVFYYRLDDTVPARLELIPYKEDPLGEGKFMVVVTPGASLNRISEGTDWTFVLDVSGSMDGEKIITLAEGVSKVLGKMTPNDRFRIITFNNNAYDFSGGYIQATGENVNQMITQVKNIQASGGTDLFAGLSESIRGLDADRITGVILVTDGVANVGQTQHSAFLGLIKKYDLRLFTLVIGNSANTPLLDKLAKESGGFALSISSSDDLIGRILQAKAKVLHEKLHDVELEFHGEKVKDLTPSKIGSLYLGQQVVVFGKYGGSGKVSIELKAKVSGEKKSWKCTAYLPDQDVDNPEIERLWALSNIEERMEIIRENGETDKLKQEIITLGTTYSLVTDYTSMIVVKEEASEKLGITKINQSRVHKERKAFEQRLTMPTKNYRADNRYSDNSSADPSPTKGGMFSGAKAPNIGSGPIGPLFLILIFWMKFKRKNNSLN